jgi:peptide/nickel transport system substrate-binding protein
MRSLILALVGAVLIGISPAVADPRHAIAMHGDPALAADFQHFPYVNPDAPKGGRIDYAVLGSFDSLNPFIVQGQAARGVLDLAFGYNVFDSLMQRSYDEPFSLYPLIAKSVETDEQRSFVAFTLDERARFSDGTPVTPDDVIFTFELLRDKGFPRYATSVNKIATMEKVGTLGVRFTFKAPDRELPLILGLMPVLPKHATDAENFQKSTLKPLIGSGPYTIDQVRPGELLSLKRNPDYWAKDIPSKRGFDNFDAVRINYFRDENAMFEAFKKGVITLQIETNTGRWAGDYDFPAVNDGRVVKETFDTGLPSGMLGFVMNTRRPVFKERAVRAALATLFDFEWANKNLFNDAYTRTKSFYDGSDLSSSGVPASDAEKALLASFPEAVTPEIMAAGWTPPMSDGSGRDRAFLKRGLDALKAAGCAMQDGRLVGPDGQPIAFEILLNGNAAEPVAVAWQRTLEKLGIAVSVRVVDSAQYVKRQQVYDFDVIIQNYTSSLSPGVEQVGRWGSAMRDRDGTFNYAGAADPAVDAMIETLLKATSREDFVTAVRAYDRVLLSGFYVVPLYYLGEQRIARWKSVAHPETVSIYGYQLPTWWHSAE